MIAHCISVDLRIMSEKEKMMQCLNVRNIAMKQVEKIDKNKVVILECYESGETVNVTDRHRRELQQLADLMEMVAGQWDRRGTNRF